MRLNWRLSLIVLAIAASIVFAVHAYTQQPHPPLPNAETIFQAVRPTLEKGGVPLRLPTYIPSSSLPTQPGYTPPPIQASVPKPQPPKGYQVVLGYSSSCEGENTCRFGTVSGVPKSRTPIQSEYQQTLKLYSGGIFEQHRSKEPMVQVKLTKGITGWFLPWVCTNTCTDTQIVWDEYAYRYTVGVKQGDKVSLVKMANSAILGGSR